MKMIIKPGRHRLRLVFWVPLHWLKWRWVQRKVDEYAPDINLRDIYRALKETKRRFHRFLLVEATDNDASVKIYL